MTNFRTTNQFARHWRYIWIQNILWIMNLKINLLMSFFFFFKSLWLQFCNTFCRGSKRPLVFEPLRQTIFSFLFLLTSLNENKFKTFSPCPLKEDTLKNLKVLKFQPYIRVSRKFRDEFSSLFLPVFEDFFNTDFWILVWATLGFKMTVQGEIKAQWCSDRSPLSPARAQLIT